MSRYLIGSVEAQMSMELVRLPTLTLIHRSHWVILLGRQGHLELLMVGGRPAFMSQIDHDRIFGFLFLLFHFGAHIAELVYDVYGLLNHLLTGRIALVLLRGVRGHFRLEEPVWPRLQLLMDR